MDIVDDVPLGVFAHGLGFGLRERGGAAQGAGSRQE